MSVTTRCPQKGAWGIDSAGAVADRAPSGATPTAVRLRALAASASARVFSISASRRSGSMS
ncbi:hypothetical protein D3C78_1580600 [compost metagenome]